MPQQTLVLQIQITFERIKIVLNGFLFQDCAAFVYNKKNKIKKSLEGGHEVKNDVVIDFSKKSNFLKNQSKSV